MQIRFPLGVEVSENALNNILPGGYRADLSKYPKFNVVHRDTEELAGIIEGHHGHSVVYFSDSEPGKKFIQAWGLKHPAYNPMSEMSAFVYRSPTTGLYQLDKNPISVIGREMSMRKQYSAIGNLYYTYFYLGNLTGSNLVANRIGRFEFTGQIENWTGPETLELGNIENENTM